jgi:hypothetical protein
MFGDTVIVQEAGMTTLFCNSVALTGILYGLAWQRQMLSVGRVGTLGDRSGGGCFFRGRIWLSCSLLTFNECF